MGARMIPFGGWEMPVEYSGISEEHLAVRTAAGLFDVSHMGEVEIAGSQALAAVQRMSCNDASRLAVGQVQYSALTTHDGTFVDDLLVYRLADDHFLLVINASNIDRDVAWIREEIRPFGDAVAVNASSRYALLALQGPRAAAILQPLTGVELNSIQYYWFATGEVTNVRAMISRTGYTGEDGFELSWLRRRRTPYGAHCWRPGRQRVCSRSASGRGTHCASKRRCGCTAATWTTRPPC